MHSISVHKCVVCSYVHASVYVVRVCELTKEKKEIKENDKWDREVQFAALGG